MEHALSVLQVQAMGIYHYHIQKAPQDPKSPVPRLPVHSIVGLLLVILVYPTHVHIVSWQGWKTRHLINDPILFLLPGHWICIREEANILVVLTLVKKLTK